MSHRIIRVSLLSSIALCALAGGANAAGFYIQEQSVRGLGSAFSGSATNLEDASTIYFNPAGMTKLDGFQTQAGVNVIIPDSKVSDRGSVKPFAASSVGGKSDNPYEPTPVPNGFASYQFNDNIWAGIGVTAPFGLASEYDKGWFGRFDSTKTELKVIDVQPTVAYKVNDMLSVGAGVNIQKASADLQSAALVGLGVEGTSTLKGYDYGFGYTVGLQFKPLDTTTFGLNYKSSVHHELDGRITVTTPTGAVFQPGVLSTDGKAKLTTPDIASFGVSHKVNDKLTLQGQATWFGWNNFDNITAVRDSGAVASRVDQNYQTTWAFAVGAEYAATDKWTLRTGVQFDETPTTDEFRTSRTPDGDRTWLSLGTTYKLNEAMDIDLAGTYIHVASEDISLTRGGGGALGPAGQMRAKTEGDVGIIALGIKYKF